MRTWNGGWFLSSQDKVRKSLDVCWEIHSFIVDDSIELATISVHAVAVFLRSVVVIPTSIVIQFIRIRGDVLIRCHDRSLWWSIRSLSLGNLKHETPHVKHLSILHMVTNQPSSLQVKPHLILSAKQSLMWILTNYDDKFCVRLLT